MTGGIDDGAIAGPFVAGPLGAGLFVGGPLGTSGVGLLCGRYVAGGPAGGLLTGGGYFKYWVRYRRLCEVKTFVPTSEHPMEEIQLRPSQNQLETLGRKYPGVEPVRVHSQVVRKGLRKGAGHRGKGLFSVGISFIPHAGCHKRSMVGK